jgi:probable addiction module antidote protein
MAAQKPKRRPKLRTLPWDPAARLKTNEDIANYLEAVLEDGDPVLIAAALNDITRAK